MRIAIDGTAPVIRWRNNLAKRDGASLMRGITGRHVLAVPEIRREATLKFRKTAEFVELRSSLKKPVLLYVGQFIHRKGILQLLDALSGLKNERWSLLLVGDGPLQGEIKKRIEAQGLSDRVVLTGFKEKEELA